MLFILCFLCSVKVSAASDARKMYTDPVIHCFCSEFCSHEIKDHDSKLSYSKKWMYQKNIISTGSLGLLVYICFFLYIYTYTRSSLIRSRNFQSQIHKNRAQLSLCVLSNQREVLREAFIDHGSTAWLLTRYLVARYPQQTDRLLGKFDRV